MDSSLSNQQAAAALGGRSVPAYDGRLVDLPYPTVFSLSVILSQVQAFAEEENSARSWVAREILKRFKNEERIHQPFYDLSELEPFRPTLGLIQLLLAPAALEDGILYKISLPFQLQSIHSSPALRQLTEQPEAAYTFDEQDFSIKDTYTIMAGCMILRSCYGVDIRMDPKVLFTVPHPKTGLLRFYRPLIENRYVEVIVDGKKPKLSTTDIDRLLGNINDINLWLELLPPSKFAFHGFMYAELIDVTREEAMSRLKRRLISRKAVLDIGRARRLADLVRIQFELPELQLGLTALDYPRQAPMPSRYPTHYHLLYERFPDLKGAEGFSGSIYEQALARRQPMIFEDLRHLAPHDAMAKALLDMGLKSLLLAPLLNSREQAIGLVELASPRPYAVNSFVEIQFREIISLFRTAVARSREEVDNRIQAILREQFTSLHHSVEWRFVQEAFRIMEARQEGREVISDDIVFKNVYPLFAQADIVGSTRLRNTAVYEDLRENMLAAQQFLDAAGRYDQLPLADRIRGTINRRLQVPIDEFTSKHETDLGNLLRLELLPLVDQLATRSGLADAAQRYRDLIDPQLGLVTTRRREYERSLKMINSALSNFFEQRDSSWQKSLLHYFEQSKTDGIQYEVFVGQSLLRQGEFSQVHLRNFRLAQLIDLCAATRLISRLQQDMPLAMQTAQLIFAYTSPLDIRFRMDEKRFDVDGAYDLRYEILKKRIDKATIKQGRERLTLPAHVAVVYLQEQDRHEYISYIDYLADQGQIDGPVEELELDPLQSVQGLKALRFRPALLPGSS